ncbi:MAG: TetR family transcriptional regulator C-terminal domain-containing protein [Lachnospiraceae bacterium]|nr:TetR family transcriptional regulator C-terminal domain-containing protein [Lachnospiraceae bacterium]
MKETDTWIQYTKSALKGALLRILKTKPIAKVTIKELCEEAHLNRGTFYLHYCEPNDVLKEIEEDFVSEHLGRFSPYINSRHDLPILSKLFFSMIENRELCLILMGPNGAPQFTERIKHMMWPTLLEDWRRDFPQYSLEDLEFAYEFIFPGATNLILQWLRNPKGLTTEEIARRLDRLGHYCHLAIREFSSAATDSLP